MMWVIGDLDTPEGFMVVEDALLHLQVGVGSEQSLTHFRPQSVPQDSASYTFPRLHPIPQKATACPP